MSWLSSIFSPPAPTDISKNALSFGNTVGNTQTQANVGAQKSNQYDQSNMYGNTQYVQTGVGPNGMPIYGINTSGNAQTTPLWNNMFTGQGMAGGQANQLLQGANYGANNPTSTIGDMSSGLTNQRMNAYLASINPFMSTQTTQLDTKLRNQGLLPGQPGYDNAMRELTNTQGLTVAGAAAGFQPQAFNQATSLYQMPLTMGQQLAQWGAPQDPTKSLVQGPQMQPADFISGSAVGAKLGTDQYKAQMDQYSGLLKGIGNVAGAGVDAAMMFSDERIKENKDEVGSLHDGTPVYSYNYIGDETPRIGLMAQDVEKTRPDAVKEFGGIKAVDYDKATARSRAMKALLG